MDIRGWPLDQIMQLPDCYFGRRWPVICGVKQTALVDSYAIVKTGVPDRCVVWELSVCAPAQVAERVGIEFAWGDQLPTTGVMWSALQKMFPCQGIQDGVNYEWRGGARSDQTLRRLRLVSPGSGLRPCIRVDAGSSSDICISAAFVISSFPTEVPDCLISEYRRSL